MPGEPQVTVGRSSRSILISNLTVAFLQFLFLLLVSRFAGPLGRGVLAFAIALPTMLSFLAPLGLDAAGSYFAAREPALRQMLITLSLVTGLVLGGLFAAATVGIFLWRPEWVPAGVSDLVLLGALATTIVLAAQVILASTLTGSGHVNQANLTRLMMPAVSLVCLGIALATGVLTPAGAVLAWILGRLAGFAAAVWLAQRSVGFAAVGAFKDARRRVVGFGVGAYPSALGEISQRRLDTVVLGASASAQAVGIYSAAVNVAEVMAFLPAAVASALLPAGAAREERETALLTRRAALVVFFLSVLTAAAAAAAAPWLIRIAFGSEFDASVLPLRIMLVALVGLALRWVLHAGLLAMKKTVLASTLTVVTMIVTVILYLVFVPRFGIAGAAWSSLAGHWLAAILALVAWRRLYRETNAPSDLRMDLKVIREAISALLPGAS